MSNISSGGHLWQLDGGQLREEPGSLAGADVGDGCGDDGGDIDGDVNGDGAGDIDSDGDVVSDVGGTPPPQIPHFFRQKNPSNLVLIFGLSLYLLHQISHIKDVSYFYKK